MDWNFYFLLCYLAAWHEEEKNKCKHGPEVSYANEIRGSFNEVDFKAFGVSVVANQHVAIREIIRI